MDKRQVVEGLANLLNPKNSAVTYWSKSLRFTGHMLRGNRYEKQNRKHKSFFCKDFTWGFWIGQRAKFSGCDMKQIFEIHSSGHKANLFPYWHKECKSQPQPNQCNQTSSQLTIFYFSLPIHFTNKPWGSPFYWPPWASSLAPMLATSAVTSPTKISIIKRRSGCIKCSTASTHSWNDARHKCKLIISVVYFSILLQCHLNW